MNCQNIQQFTAEYIRKELPPEQEIIFNRHLGECSLCAKETKQFAKIMGYVDKIEVITPSPGFSSKLQRSLDKKKFDIWEFFAFIKTYWSYRFLYAPEKVFLLAALSLCVVLLPVYYFYIFDPSSHLVIQEQLPIWQIPKT